MCPILQIGWRVDTDVNSSASLRLARGFVLQARRMRYFNAGLLGITVDVLLNFVQRPFISDDVIIALMLPESPRLTEEFVNLVRGE